MSTAKFDFTRLGKPFEADWPVVVPVPQNGGTTRDETFSARFRLLEGEEAQTAAKAADQARETLRRAFVGFGAGEAQEWSETVRDQLIETDFVRVGLARAYGAFSIGAAAKN